jgi:parallel beta-helix repeat protein
MRRSRALVSVTTAIVLFAAVGWWLAMMSTATPAGAANLCVPTLSYGTIQAAINQASDGDTIQIVSGTYYETLSITEDITLEGGWSKGCGTRTYPDPQYTVIDGGAEDHVVQITGGSAATLDGLTLTNGQSDKGGGVYASGASPTLDHVVVTSNVISPTGTSIAQGAYGAGVCVHNGTITLRDCDVTYNTSYPGHTGYCFGGGVALYGPYGAEGKAVIEGTRIMSNTNPSDSHLHAGGLYLYPYSQVTFGGTDNLIAYNEARAGGGVYMYGNVDLEGVLILENHASQNGGGIFLASGYNGGRIANNYLVRNGATMYAASVMASDSSVEIANNTIVGASSGEGIYVNNSATGMLELTNNIVTSHAVGITGDASASVTLSHNDVWGNTTNYSMISPGSGDVSLDPDFVDPGNDNHHLDAGSQCIDAGTMVDGLYFDYDGDRRTGTLFDIGADEYHTKAFFVTLIVRKYSP